MIELIRRDLVIYNNREYVYNNRVYNNIELVFIIEYIIINIIINLLVVIYNKICKLYCNNTVYVYL